MVPCALNFRYIREPITSYPNQTRRSNDAKAGKMKARSSIAPLPFLFFVLLCLFSSARASIPKVFRHTNIHRIIDLTKPYVRESTTVVVENISNTTQTEYWWGIPLSLVPKLSYLEVKEKSSCSSPDFPIEKVHGGHPYQPLKNLNRKF